MDNPGDSNGQLLPWVKRTIKKLATAPSIPHLPHQQSSRRQLSLIVINASLNVLLWASVFCVMVAIYLIGADPGDNTNIPTVILTLTSVSNLGNFPQQSTNTSSLSLLLHIPYCIRFSLSSKEYGDTKELIHP